MALIIKGWRRKEKQRYLLKTPMNQNLISRFICCGIAIIGLSFWTAQSTQAQSDARTVNRSWCLSGGGTWTDEGCRWEELNMERLKEAKLSRECGEQNGIWHAWFEEIYNPKCTGICLGVVQPEDYDLVEKGVVCAWYSDIDPAF